MRTLWRDAPGVRGE